MRRRFLLSVLTLALGLGAGVGIVEVGLRLSGFSNPVTSQRDDYCGTIRRPGVEYLQADEGRALVRFNAAGFRDEEWSLAKPADTFRIAVLGDSYVEAVQVALGERFTEVLERELDGTPAVGDRRVHVLTFGVSGFGTAQELMCLRHHVWQYSPDLVILAVTTGNDLRNNSRALQNDEGRPYFAYVNGSLTLDTSFRQSADHRRSARRELALGVIERSRAAQAAYRFWQNRSSLARRVRIRDAARATEIGEEAGLDSWAYMESTDTRRNEAWKVTEGLFSLMSREVAERGAQFLLVTLSNAIQVHPNPEIREKFMRRLGVDDLFYPERRIAAAGRRDAFVVVNLAPGLLDYATTTGAFLHGFGERLGSGHWNQEGHREAGRRLAAEVRNLLGTGHPTSLADGEGATPW